MKKAFAVLAWLIVTSTLLYWVMIGAIRLEGYATGVGFVFGFLSLITLAIGAAFVFESLIVEQK